MAQSELPSAHVQTNTLDLTLAQGTGLLSSNPLRDLMNARFRINLGIGNPSPDVLSADVNDRYYAQATEKYGGALGEYGTTQGELGLREAITDYYHVKGIDVHPDHIVVVNGAQEALDIASMVFISPDVSAIATTDPTYIGFMQPMKLRRPKYVGYNPEDANSLHHALQTHPNIAMIYDQPTLHNPLTITQTTQQRDATAEAALSTKTVVLEDSPYLDLHDDELPLPVYSRAPENTLLVGSASKMLAPALRTGWVVIKNPQLRDAFVQIKQGLNIASSRINQAMTEMFLRDPDRESHLATIRALYHQRRQAAMTAVQELLPESWGQQMIDPHGGMFLTLANNNSPVTTQAIAEEAKQRGLAVVPLEIFSPDGTAQGLRLNVIYNDIDTTREGIKILGEVIRDLEAAI